MTPMQMSPSALMRPHALHHKWRPVLPRTHMWHARYTTPVDPIWSRAGALQLANCFMLV
jgi:hypothetical protein